MRKLESPRIKEWTVQLPASAETTEIRSNNKKIFVGTAVLLATLLTSPFFLAEWNARRTTPQLEFARALRLPVIAEQIVQDLRPSRRGQVDLQQFNENQLESLRMLTLRIQQSAHRSGSVMVFSSLDSDASAAPLMAAVAQCLAQREERVLLIDAVSPDKSSHPILNLFPIPIDAATTQNAHSDRPGEYQNADAVDAANGRQPENQQSENERPQDVRPDVEQSKAPSPRPDALVVAPGLAEFFSQTHPCEAHALIRPSACRGIDVITSGSTSFPREALASSALTALLEDCSRSYTIILVNGPPARWNADLEMLAARADGVVLTATPAIKNNFHARNVVQDLIELEAPIIGVVC